MIFIILANIFQSYFQAFCFIILHYLVSGIIPFIFLNFLCIDMFFDSSRILNQVASKHYLDFKMIQIINNFHHKLIFAPIVYYFRNKKFFAKYKFFALSGAHLYLLFRSYCLLHKGLCPKCCQYLLLQWQHPSPN